MISNLRVLKLRCSVIKDDVTVNVARHLAENTSLKNVDLSRDKISETGALALAAALKQNTTLDLLNIAGNQLSSVDFLAFAEALNVNQTLKEFHVYEIGLSVERSNQLFELDRFPGLFKRALNLWQQPRLKELAKIVRANEQHSLLPLEIDNNVSP